MGPGRNPTLTSENEVFHKNFCRIRPEAKGPGILRVTGDAWPSRVESFACLVLWEIVALCLKDEILNLVTVPRRLFITALQ